MTETELAAPRVTPLPALGGVITAERLRWAGGWPLALLIYVGTAIGFTWPLVLHIGSGLYLSPGRPYGDYTGSIANLQAMLHPFHFPFAPATISQFNFPDGIPLNWGQNLTWLPETIVQVVLGLIFGARASFELMLLLAYAVSGLCMYGLVRRVVDNRMIAVLAGWAFAFYPYAISNGEHPVYANGWPFALMLWAILTMADRPTWRRGALAGGATVLAMAWTSYYLLFAGIAFAAAVVACLILGWRGARLRSTLVALLPACGLVVAWLVFVLGLSAFDPAAGVHAPNDISAVYQQSALPVNFVLAPARNFLIGHFTGATILRHDWVGTEKTLYLGDSLLGLAIIAVLSGLLGRLPARIGRATLIAAFVMVGCAITSFAPTWHVFGTQIKLPSWYIFVHVTSGFRIYERFVIVIECALCVLAAVGVWVIYDGVVRHRPRLAVILVGLIAAFVVCDLWAPIPDHFERLAPDPIFKVLARQPPGGYADLPLSPASTAPEFTPLFDQAFAGRHPIMNGYNPGTPSETRDLTLNNVSLVRSRAILQTLGVKYFLFENHPNYPDVNGPSPTHGVTLIAQDAFAKLYRNTTRGAPIITTPAGFSYLELDGRLPSSWMVAPSATLEIQAPCRHCTGEMSFDIASFAQGRMVTITNLQTGKPLLHIREVTGSVDTFRLPVSFDRKLTLAITASPGPQSITAATGSPDPRSVSVEVIDPRVRIRGLKMVGAWPTNGLP